MNSAVYANPSRYGIVNNLAPTYDAAVISAITGGAVTDGSSLFCNFTVGAPHDGLRAGASVDTWQFADGVHPTPGGHRIISDYVRARLPSFGWTTYCHPHPEKLACNTPFEASHWFRSLRWLLAVRPRPRLNLR